LQKANEDKTLKSRVIEIVVINSLALIPNANVSEAIR
jgi:hypothetical protein